MDKKPLEHISSLMDGEISRETGLFLTRRLASDEVLCATWERYHLIRDCIRQPGSKQVVTGLCEKLNATLHAEALPRAALWHHQRWLRPLSGVAIAASVALLALVFALPQTTTPTAGQSTALVTPAQQSFVSPNPLEVIPLSQPVSYSPGRQLENARLNTYLLRHNQMAGMAGRQGFVSFVPIVAAPPAPRADEVRKARSERPGLIENK